MKMKKRILSLTLCVVLLFSALPVNALAAENLDTGGLCEHHTEHTADCGYSEGTEGMSCGFICDICTTQDSGESQGTSIAAGAVQVSVEDVQEMIDVLPTAEELSSMNTEEQQAAYEKVQTAYDAYNALTDEQKGSVVGVEVFDSLFQIFNGMTNTLTDTSAAYTLVTSLEKITIDMDGYMSMREFAAGLPKTLTLKSNTDNSELKVTPVWYYNGNDMDYHYRNGTTISTGGNYKFTVASFQYGRNIKSADSMVGYTPEVTITAKQQRVQMYLPKEWTVDESTKMITVPNSNSSYQLSIDGYDGKHYEKTAYLSGEALEPVIKDGTRYYRLHMTLTGSGAENADVQFGYPSAESYLTDAEPGFATFAVMVPFFENNGLFAVGFKDFTFYQTGTYYSLSFVESAGEDREYKMSTVDGSSNQFGRLGKVFFNVTPPDDNRAWAVMVIPENRVQTGDLGGDVSDEGIKIDTDWGRTAVVEFKKGPRYFYNSLFQNRNGNFAAVYLKENVAAVISEITLEAGSVSPVEVGLNEGAELSVTANYQYQKLNGMTDVSYQWYQCDADGSNPQKIDGATSASYNPSTSAAGTYYYYAEAKFNPFEETNAYLDEDDNLLMDYDSFGWASDTVTKSEVMTLAVGQSSVEVEEPEPETGDGFVYGDEIAFLNLVVKVGDASVSTTTGTVTISRVNEDGSTTLLGTMDEIPEESQWQFIYDTSNKGLKIGDNKVRIVFTSKDGQIAGSSTDMTITLNRRKIQTVVTSDTITKPYDGTTAANVNLGVKDNELLSDDTVTVSAPSAVYNDANVGNDKAITLGVLTLAGEDAVWYEATAPAEGITGSVTPAQITVRPIITGNAVYGERLTASYTPVSNETVSYQWNRDGVEIAGATGKTYTLTAEDVGKNVTVTVTAVDGNHTGSQTSEPVTVDDKTESSGSGTIYYALLFETNGGGEISAVVREAGSTIDLSEYVPAREGYDFTGWYVDEELTQPVTVVMLDRTKTIYASWKKTDSRREQEIFMTVPAQERDLKNGSRNTMSRVCTLKLGFAVEDPDLSLSYETSDTEVATVKDGKITYQGVGTCTVTVTAAATAMCKAAKLEITVKVGKLGTPTFTPSVTRRTAKKAFVATSSTVRGVDGWEVQYSIRPNFWRATTKDFPETGIKLYRKTCTTMHSNRTYYIHVRGYQVIDGKKVYSDWSPMKTIRTK